MYDIEQDQLIAQPQEEQSHAEAPQAANQESGAAPAVPGPDNISHNLRRLREQKERVERERDEAVRRLQEIESRTQQSAVQPEDDDISLGADDLAEGKHLNKVAKKIKRLEDELRQYRQQSSVESVEVRLKSQYPDFDKVVSRENVELLRDTHPELAASIKANPDMYSQATAAYKLIRQFGIYQDTAAYDADKAAAQKNASKPRPTASISPQQGDSPISKANAFANGLTDELKKQLLHEMQQVRKAH